MTEWKFFTEDVPEVSTHAFHRDRERAPHLEQPVHQPRLYAALQFIYEAHWQFNIKTVSDLGCGDGGLLSLLKGNPHNIRAWGYDFQPSNAAGWEERGVDGTLLDVFRQDQQDPKFGDVSVMTEVLEHLADPHGVLRWVSRNSQYLVASSPWNETPESHDACHAWAWDQEGYHTLLSQNGWSDIACEIVGQFHVVLVKSTA